MSNEKYVITIEQAKELTNFNVGENYRPLFVWVPEFPIFNDKLRLCTFIEFESRLKQSILSDEAKALVGYYPAYTLGELMRMAGNAGEISCRFKEGKNTWEWLESGADIEGHGFVTPEQAAADMVIKLLNDDYITPDQCNSALEGE